MLILTQNEHAIVNLDLCESIEIDYSVGNAYGIKAVMERSWNEAGDFALLPPEQKSVVRLGIYKSSLTAEAVMQSVFYAYERDCKTYKMPPEGASV